MNKKMSKRQRDIKTKLMAAICMLLVSSIMMVSTTYAWFTLSTAPEVTGIQTAVGANGNLEMALLPANGLDTTEADFGITTDVGDSNKLPVYRNVTWGNLVDVSDNSAYGLSNITLYPSALNLVTQTDADSNVTKFIHTKPLQTPQYGSDGRISTLEANTLTGGYNAAKGQFLETAGYGVRAIGEASSMTARQMAYRNAVADATTYKGQAQNAAKISLQKRGPDLAGIAITHALANGGDTYTDEDFAVISGALTDLDAALDQIGLALKAYIIADSIAPSTVTDDTYNAIVTAINNAELSAIETTVTDAVVTEKMTFMIGKLAEAKANVAAAQGVINNRGNASDWNTIYSALKYVLDTDTMTINGMTVEKASADRQALIDSVTGNNYTADLVMKSGSGVYTDISDFCGQYTASFKMDVDYNGLTIPMNTNMTAVPDSSAEGYENVVYLSSSYYTVSSFSSADGGDVSNPISEFYGYIIDLAFRTNAANSKLLLQQTAIDRIYSDSKTNENTMGHGATMSFKSAGTTFTAAQVGSLMSNLRLVFFDADTMEIIRFAKLDMDQSTTADDGTVSAPIMLVTDETYGTALGSLEIMDLPQNEAVQLSVMVYLDGANLRNADVAADLVKSMTGTMNLQFSSSAPLVPMEYSDLRSEDGGASSEVVTISNVSAPDGYTASSAYYTGSTLAFALSGDLTGKTVTVSIDGGDAITAQSGTYMGMTGYGVTVPTGTTVTASSAIVITVEGGTSTDSGTTATGTDFTSGKVTASEGVTINSASFTGSDVTINLSANEGKNITGISAITVDGTEVSAYNYANGVLTFTYEGITADSAVALTVTTVNAYTVSVPVGVNENETATTATVAEGGSYEFEVDTGYTLGTVTMGDNEVTGLTADGDGIYKISNITGNVIINVTANG